MNPLKTKEEMYNEYLWAIEELQMDIVNEENNKRRADREIERINTRIEKLKETAEMYKPNK